MFREWSVDTTDTERVHAADEVNPNGKRQRPQGAPNLENVEVQLTLCSLAHTKIQNGKNLKLKKPRGKEKTGEPMRLTVGLIGQLSTPRNTTSG